MIETMFSIPVVKYSLSNWEQKKKGFLDLLEQQVLELGEECVYSDYNYEKTPDEQLDLYNPQSKYLETVRGLVKDEMRQFARDLGCDPVIVRTWFERAYNKMYHPIHTHGHGGWSAVLYIEYDPSVHTSTVFVSPFNHFITGMQLCYMPEVKEGDLILFPSFVLHYTQPNLSDVKRTVASFNVTVDLDNMPLGWMTKHNYGDAKIEAGQSPKHQGMMDKQTTRPGGDLDAFG